MSVATAAPVPNIDSSEVASPGTSIRAPGALPQARTELQVGFPSPLASMSTLAIGSTSGAADLSSIFAACREATHELDLGARAAVSHREKCAVVLGAAVAVNIALAEADAVHAALDPHVQTQLKRLAVGVLSVLGLAVARVRVYGTFSRAQKAARIFRYAATAGKFDELRLDLEALEGQLWNLTGAVGGLGAGGTTGGGGASARVSVLRETETVASRRGKKGKTTTRGATSMRKLSAGPDTSRRLLRGGAAHWIMGGNVRVMCAAGADGAELWWSSNRARTLSAFDLFLQSRRAVDAPATRRRVPRDARERLPAKDFTGPPRSPLCCADACFGEVTAIAAEESSALLWTGSTAGEITAWDTDVACQWGGPATAFAKNNAAVTAIAPVASGVAWAALADGTLVEVRRPLRPELDVTVQRVVCAPGDRPSAGANAKGAQTTPSTTTALSNVGVVGWDGAPGARRATATARELFRLGPLVWASMDDGVLEAWDVDAGTCAAVAPHRDLGPCVGVAAHANAGQIVTCHASGAVQLWCAMLHGSDSASLGTRAEMLAGPNSADGPAVGAAALDRLLCVGYRRGWMKVFVLPDRHDPGAVPGGTPTQGFRGEAAAGDAFASFSPLSPRVLRSRAPPGKIRAHRSGMTLLRAVDGTGHVGVATAGFFGSMIFWPLAELEAAVAATRDGGHRRDAGAAARYAVMSPKPTDARLASGRPEPRRLPFASEGRRDGDRAVAVRAGETPRVASAAGKDARRKDSGSAESSLGQDTALIAFPEIRLKKCVGEGSFGRVYCAVWAGHTEVAVKMLGPPSSFVGKADPLERQRGRPAMAVGAKADAAETAAAGRRAAARRDASAAKAAAGIAGNVSASEEETDDSSEEETDIASAEVLDELEKEVGIMARLRHPNIVLLLGVVRSPPAIVEEYCARGSLFSVLQRHTKPGVPALEWRVRLQMALGAAAGMCYLHNCAPPVIHRDLKSPNLMVDRYFRVKVGDFNLSRIAMAGRGSSVGPESSQGGLHSPRWMAPEVLRQATYSKASDVYSFAIVLWEIRTLAVPWAQSGQWQVVHAVVEEGLRPEMDEPPSPSFAGIDAYDALIADAWAQEPSERPPFETVITRLQGFVDQISAVHSGRRAAERSGASSAETSAFGVSAGVTVGPTGGRAAAAAAGAASKRPPATAGSPPSPAERGVSRGVRTDTDGKRAVGAESEARDARGDGGDASARPEVSAVAVEVALAEAPEAAPCDPAGAEAERAVRRILSRKRSAKLDATSVPKKLVDATDAAVVELRQSREWQSPTKALPPRKPPAAPPRALPSPPRRLRRR